MSEFERSVTLGRSGLRVSRIGLGASYGVGGADIEWAAERGVNFFYWGALRRPGFGRGVRAVAQRRREDAVIVVQTYTRVGFLMRLSLESALRSLGVDHADVLLLGWWNRPPPRRIIDAALALKEAGKARAIMISCHDRPQFEHMIRDPAFDAIMVRYNAAHPGAEREVFPLLDAGGARPGVVAFNATRWGTLLDPRLAPPGEARPRASDCYRFALSHPDVNVTLAGPKDRAELAEALLAIERGPMSPEEIDWMKRIGRAVRDAKTKPTRRGIFGRLAGGRRE